MVNAGRPLRSNRTVRVSKPSIALAVVASWRGVPSACLLRAKETFLPRMNQSARAFPATARSHSFLSHWVFKWMVTKRRASCNVQLHQRTFAITCTSLEREDNCGAGGLLTLQFAGRGCGGSVLPGSPVCGNGFHNSHTIF